MRFKIFIILCLCSSLIFALSDAELAQIAARIAPVGQVSVQEEAVVKVASSEKPSSSTGEKIYQQYCIVCHQNGLADAPKFRDATDWKARTKIKNTHELTDSAIHGLNAMPAKGSCNDCSEKDLKAAIEYMLPRK